MNINDNIQINRQSAILVVQEISPDSDASN